MKLLSGIDSDFPDNILINSTNSTRIANGSFLIIELFIIKNVSIFNKKKLWNEWEKLERNRVVDHGTFLKIDISKNVLHL